MLLFIWSHDLIGYIQRSKYPDFFCYIILALILYIIISYYLLTRYIFPYFDKLKWVIIPLVLGILYTLYTAIVRGLPTVICTFIFPKYLSTFHHSTYYIKDAAAIFSDVALRFFYAGPSWLIMSTSVFFALRFFLLTDRVRQRSLVQRNAMEINFLRAQLQPHFLFNTLNNIYGLLLEEEAASQKVLELADVLRYNLYETRASHITLSQECSFLKKYLDLEQQRLQKKHIQIHYEISGINESIPVQISPLLLTQPIEALLAQLEEQQEVPQHIYIKLHKETEQLLYSLTYPKINMGTKKPDFLTELQRRLDLEYPHGHRLTINGHQEQCQLSLTLILTSSIAN